MKTEGEAEVLTEPHKLSERVEERVASELKINPNILSIDALRTRILMEELDTMADTLYNLVEHVARQEYLGRKKK